VRARLAIITIASGALAACSLLTDLSGLSGAPNAPLDAAAADAGTATGEAGANDAAPGAEAGLGAFTCPADAIFCEDFESTLDAWNKDEQQGATCAATNTRPHRGAKSLRALAPFDSAAFAMNANQNQCYLEHPLPLQTSGVLAIRAYVYLVGAGQTGGFSLPWLRDPTPTGCAAGTLVSGTSDGKWQVLSYSGTGYHELDSLDAPVFDRWLCIEWVLDLRANGHVKMSVDGALVIDKDEVLADSNPFCGYRALDVGIVGHRSSGEVEAYWDDIVVASHPIGCN